MFSKNLKIISEEVFAAEGCSSVQELEKNRP